MSKPDVTDFEICRMFIHQTVNLSLARRNELYAKKEIDATEYINRRKQIEEPLRQHSKNLTIEILKGIVGDFTAHKTRIGTVTDKLKKVITDLEDFNKSIAFFSEVIGLFGSILSAASSGIAGIPNILDKFEKILSRH